MFKKICRDFFNIDIYKKKNALPKLLINQFFFCLLQRECAIKINTYLHYNVDVFYCVWDVSVSCFNNLPTPS